MCAHQRFTDGGSALARTCFQKIATKLVSSATMKPFLAGFSVFLVVCLIFSSGCNSNGPISKLNRTKYDQIHEGMSKEQVQAILGAPTSMKTEDKVIYKRSIWRYTEGDKYINITFKNDELDGKDTNLG
jgi:outer membrane protein assembly factor BamE (lipoprotein component of BamABCDE complex)